MYILRISRWTSVWRRLRAGAADGRKGAAVSRVATQLPRRRSRGQGLFPRHLQACVHPAYQDRVRYNVSLIELDEGLWMVSNVVNCDAEKVYTGMPLEV